MTTFPSPSPSACKKGGRPASLVKPNLMTTSPFVAPGARPGMGMPQGSASFLAGENISFGEGTNDLVVVVLFPFC